MTIELELHGSKYRVQPGTVPVVQVQCGRAWRVVPQCRTTVKLIRELNDFATTLAQAESGGAL